MSLLVRRVGASSSRTSTARLASIASHFGHSAPPHSPASSSLRNAIRTMASSLPATMKGVQIAKTGGIEVLEYKTDLPLPEPKEGELLVKNEFIGVNYIDTYFRTGLYKAPQLPYTLGREGAGTVVKAGPGEAAAAFKQGARVAYLAQAAYAEYTVVSTLHTYAVPDGVDNKTAAAALLQGLTAITLIREAHNVKKGDWVLVHAAAGGMGLWLCQLLRVVGAHVIGTASTPGKRELAAKAGAEVTLEYADALGDDKFVAKVKELTGGAGVAVVFDGVGRTTFDVSLACVARKGSMISFGNASGAVEPVAIARLSAANVRLMRPTLFNFLATRDEFAHFCDELFGVLSRERLDVRVHKTYRLEDVASAHTDIEGRGTTGKLLLRV